MRNRAFTSRGLARIAPISAALIAGLGMQAPSAVPPAAPRKSAADGPASVAVDPTVDLDQGWSERDRRRFYSTSQGSRMIPYRWLLALERPGSNHRFVAPENMDRIRFVIETIPDPKANPDGLPVGFVKDEGPASPAPDPAVVRSLIDEHYDPDGYPKTTEWAGFTCAACHTARIDAGDKVLRVDGGPAMADMQTFLEELNRAMRDTLDDPARGDRFARRVLGGAPDDAARSALRKELATFAPLFDFQVRVNAVPEAGRYGFARLDAFGAIFNRVASYGLGIAVNRRPSDAPVSYPPLWDTPFLDWVQTNGSSSSPIGRNLGETLGVFAEFRLTPPDAQKFQASGRLPEIAALEEWIKTLKAPAWPAGLGPGFALDPQKVAAGSALYQANCASCHPTRGPDGQFPLNPGMADRPGATIIATRSVAAGEIGTDPQFLRNFATLVDPGIFADQPGIDRRPAVPRALILITATRNILARKLREDGLTPGTPEFSARLAELNGHHMQGVAPPLGGQGYRARPLDGVWATAPFLHNGSVPNLDQLLRPADRRTKSFHVGSRRFDPALVGFDSAAGEGTFEFRTVDEAGAPIPGNSNAGHSGPGYTQAKGQDGADRDFTDGERSQLIEFLKTLR